MKNKFAFVISGREKDLGGGLTIRRVLPFAKKRMVGPFIFLDHMGPVNVPPDSGMDVRPHPHIGLSTVTYLFEGQFMHRDSLGTEQMIVPGEVNWMTAGKGIQHSERTPAELKASGQKIHGLQIWVALPIEAEDQEPSFYHHKAHELPVSQHEGGQTRVILGEVLGLKSPVKTSSELFYSYTQLKAGNTFRFKPPEQNEGALYVVRGSLTAQTPEGEKVFGESSLLVLQEGSNFEVESQTDCEFVCIGGRAFPESRNIYWNFVSSSQEKIEAAKMNWEHRRHEVFGYIPNETEWVPLPKV